MGDVVVWDPVGVCDPTPGDPMVVGDPTLGDTGDIVVVCDLTLGHPMLGDVA